MRGRVYLHTKERPSLKPSGLWLSVEDDWELWCRDENFGVDRLAHRYEVTLRGDANLLTLSTCEHIDAFTARFSEPLAASRSYHSIDWARVKDLYQGIVIAPYLWERRLAPHTLWYYGWDCASACVWDTAAIEEVRKCENTTSSTTVGS